MGFVVMVCGNRKVVSRVDTKEKAQDMCYKNNKDLDLNGPWGGIWLFYEEDKSGESLTQCSSSKP